MTTKPLPGDIPSHIGNLEDPEGRVADIAVWIDRFYILHGALRDKLYFIVEQVLFFKEFHFLKDKLYICNTFYILHDKFYVLKKSRKKDI